MHPVALEWFHRRTSAAADWPLDALLAAKGAHTISVVLPALDEEPTVGEIVAGMLPLRDAGLLDEIVVIDSDSADDTAKVAAEAGATVYHRDEILPDRPAQPGKGEVLWRSLAATTGDLIVYVDADLTDFRPSFVTGLLGPLLADPAIHLVKAFYDRPLWLDASAGGGGRVTEMTARPLLNAYFPTLAGVVQPLAGEYAARRNLLEELPFAAGYGVETGLLIDTMRAHGLDAIAQVDLGHRSHGHQDTAALGRMASTILATVMSRVAPDQPLWPTLTQFRRTNNGVEGFDHDTSWPDRPPMRSIM